jgi:orotidine-5'-phosphate decarboxylase
MMDIKEKLIVALDVSTLEEAKRFVDILYPKVTMFKVGMQLFTASGPEVVKMIGLKGAKAFLDLKYHDIPNTVYRAVLSGAITGSVFSVKPVDIKRDSDDFIMPPVFMMTVHTKGGKEMLIQAAKAAKERSEELKIAKPYIVGVTRLTSDAVSDNINQEVLSAAQLAKDSGLDGVVCAVSEAEMIRKSFGPDFIIVTPGIRSKSVKTDDQKRVATAKEALKAGSSFLVVGRPILEAADPMAAVDALI